MKAALMAIKIITTAAIITVDVRSPISKIYSGQIKLGITVLSYDCWKI